VSFGSPGSRRGDTAGRPPLQGPERAPSGANPGGTAEGLPFVPGVGARGIFYA